MKRFLVLIVGILLVVPVRTMAGSFSNTLGFSSGGMAMGNAMTAVVNDWSSVYYNVSGLGKTRELPRPAKGDSVRTGSLLMSKKHQTDMQGLRRASEESDNTLANEIALSFMYTNPVFKINITRKMPAPSNQELETKAAEELNYGITVLGAALDLNKIYRMPKFISSARLGIGLAAPADGKATKVNDIDLRTHNWLGYGREAQVATILVGIGYGFLDDMFGIGVGGQISFHGEGAVLVTDVEVGPAQQTPPSQSKMDLSTVPSAVAGLYFKPGKITSSLNGFEIGVSYRQESYMKIYPFSTGTQLKVGSSQMTLDMSIYDYYVPHTASAGISYTRWGVTLSLEAEYQMWALYEYSATVEAVYKELQTQDASHADAWQLPNFKNIIVPKAGVSYGLVDWLTLMAGYNFRPSYIDDADTGGYVNFMDNTTHTGSLGARFLVPQMGGMGGPLQVTLCFQGQYLVEREVVKTGSAAEGVNANYSLNPNYSYGGICYTAMLEVKMML